MEATIQSTTGKTRQVPVSIRVLPTSEKQKKAWKALGLCWLAMVISAPLPPVHWVSVPGLFIAGIYLFVRRLREGEYTEPFAFACPECGKEVPVKARPVSEEWEQVCPSCHHSLQVNLPLNPVPAA